MTSKTPIEKDYIGITIMTLVFITFFFGSDYVTDSKVVKFLLGGIGGVLGFSISHYTRKRSTSLRLMITSIVLFIIIDGIYIRNNENSKIKTISLSEIQGQWQTDDSDGYVIRFRIHENNAYLSISPKYEEKLYEAKIIDEELLLVGEDDILLEWEISITDSLHFTISTDDETLLFKKI